MASAGSFSGKALNTPSQSSMRACSVKFCPSAALFLAQSAMWKVTPTTLAKHLVRKMVLLFTDSPRLVYGTQFLGSVYLGSFVTSL